MATDEAVFAVGVTANVVSVDIAEEGTSTFAVVPSEVVTIVSPPNDPVAVTLPVVLEGVTDVGAGAKFSGKAVGTVLAAQRVEGVTVTATAVVCAGRINVEIEAPQLVPGLLIPDTVNVYSSAEVMVTALPPAVIVITTSVVFTTI